ncbi:hypothetical protein D3C84_1122950 [compost metagenome]
MASRARNSSMCAGNGNCRRMPLIERSAFNVAIRFSNCAVLVSGDSRCSKERMPTSSARRILLRT